MAKPAFPTQAQILRVMRAAEAGGIEPVGVRVEPNGAIVVFAYEAPPLASGAPPRDDEPNDFD